MQRWPQSAAAANWRAGHDASGRPLIEIGTSPMPNAYSMVNWPGWCGAIGWSRGSSLSVTVS